MMGYGIIAGSTLVKVPQVRHQQDLQPLPQPASAAAPRHACCSDCRASWRSPCRSHRSWGATIQQPDEPPFNQKPTTKLQIANVVRAQSAEGLAPASFELESWGLLVHAAYGTVNRLPFSSYGEAAILFCQNLLLLGLIYKYARLPAARVAGVLGLLFGLIGVLASGELLTPSYQMPGRQ